MDMAIVFGLHKFSLRAIIDHYWLIIYVFIILSLWTVAKRKKNIVLQWQQNYGVSNDWYQKLLYCICSNIYIIVFELGQKDGGVITPTALAYPLHPIRNRSRNKCQSLLVGWGVSSWRPWFWLVSSFYETYTYQVLVWQWWCVGWYDTVIPSCLVSNVYFNCIRIVQYSVYHNMDIGTMWHYALVSCILSQFIGLAFGCALFWPHFYQTGSA